MRNPPNTQENLNTRGILIDLGRSTATELKRASPEFPRASNLSPRRKSPSSREIVIIRELFTASRSISWLTLYLHYKKALRQLVLTELRRTLQNCNVYGLGCYFLMVLCLTLFPGKWRVAQVP